MVLFLAHHFKVSCIIIIIVIIIIIIIIIVIIIIIITITITITTLIRAKTYLALRRDYRLQNLKKGLKPALKQRLPFFLLTSHRH